MYLTRWRRVAKLQLPLLLRPVPHLSHLENTAQDHLKLRLRSQRLARTYLFYSVSCNSGSKIFVEHEDPVSVFFLLGRIQISFTVFHVILYPNFLLNMRIQFLSSFPGEDSYLFYSVSCNSGSKLLVEHEDPVSLLFFWGKIRICLLCFM
jgi:hypothetical protein